MEEESAKRSSSDLDTIRFDGSGLTGLIFVDADGRLELARSGAVVGVARGRFLVGGGGAIGVVRSMPEGDDAARSVFGDVRSTMLAALDRLRGLLDAAVRLIVRDSRGIFSCISCSGEEGDSVACSWRRSGGRGLLLSGGKDGDEKLPVTKAAT